MAKPEKLMLCPNKRVNLLKTEGEFVKRKALGLFATFFKIGAFTFGGGYAMIPLIQREIVDKKQWATNEDLLDIIAIAESTPGPIAVNAATFIGSKIDGFFGALFATLGVVLPSFLIILAIARCYKKFKSSKIVAGLMSGLKPAVIGLIAAAVLTVGKTVFLNSATPTGFPATVSDWFRTVSSALVFVLALFACRKKLHPILMILIAAALGIAFGLLGEMLVA